MRQYPPAMLGRELQKSRESAGLTQEELAFLAKVDGTYISQLENDRKSPTVEVLLRLCHAMKTQASQIIARIEKSDRTSSSKVRK